MSAVTFAQRTAHNIGIDRAVAFTVIGRVLSGLCQIGTLALVARCLSLGTQGYYYTFSSVAALQVFFELGLSTVLVQTASHEMAHLRWEGGALVGEARSRARLASLAQLSARWYGCAAAFMFITVLPAGLLFFSAKGNIQMGWQAPWIALVISTGLALLVSPFLSIFEGTGRVADVAARRLVHVLFGTAAAWICLESGHGLYAPAMFEAAGVCVSLGFLLRHGKLAWQSIQTTQLHAIDWKSEIWPFQWRIAISWLSGYFIFQIANPILFATSGPVEAGRMGMTMSILGGVSTISMAWLTTKAPTFGALIARRDWEALDNLHRSASRRSITASIVFSGIFLVGDLALCHMHHPFATRLVSPAAVGILLVTLIGNAFVFSMATYLRAHRKEPYLVTSILIAVGNAILTFALAPAYGSLGAASAYAAVNLTIGVGGGTYIFIKKRQEWHTC